MEIIFTLLRNLIHRLSLTQIYERRIVHIDQDASTNLKHTHIHALIHTHKAIYQLVLPNWLAVVRELTSTRQQGKNWLVHQREARSAWWGEGNFIHRKGFNKIVRY